MQDVSQETRSLLDSGRRSSFVSEEINAEDPNGFFYTHHTWKSGLKIKLKGPPLKTKGFLCFNDSLWCILRCVCFSVCVSMYTCVWQSYVVQVGFQLAKYQERPIKLLVLLHAPPRFWGYMNVPSHPVCGVLRTSCMLSKHSISWATSSVYTI